MTMRTRIMIIAVPIFMMVVSGLVFLLWPPQDSTSAELHDIMMLQNNQISSFDPLEAYQAGHIQMVKQLFNTLVDVDIKGQAIPSIAKEWQSEDGIVWRIKLRDDISFHADPCFRDDSQRRLTAQDVVFTFKRLLSPQSKSLGVSYFWDIAGATHYHEGKVDAISGLRVIDPYAIEITLTAADYGFPARLALPYVSIVPEIATKKYGEAFAQHPVGTGPFRLEKYVANTFVSFTRNSDYWEYGLPTLEHIKIFLVTDENRAMLMFRNGESDFLELSRPLYEQYQQAGFSSNSTITTQDNAQINMYLFNLGTLQNQNVRQGLSLALNRKKLVSIISQEGTIANSLFPPAIFPALAKTDPELSSDIEEARNKLAGLDTPLRLVCFEDAMSRAIAEAYAQSLGSLGVKVDIEAVPFPVLVERLSSSQYDLIQLYWGPIYSDPAHYLTPFLTKSFPPNGNNFNKYSNPEVDRLVAQSQTLKDKAADEALIQAQKLILDDMPFVLLYFKKTARISNKRYEMPLHPLQYRLYKLANTI